MHWVLHFQQQTVISSHTFFNDYNTFLNTIQDLFSQSQVEDQAAMLVEPCHKYLLKLTTSKSWNRVLLEKIVGLQLVKRTSSFFGACMFITTFTRACQLSLSWVRSIQSMPPLPLLQDHFNIIHICVCLHIVFVPQVCTPKPYSTSLVPPVCNRHNPSRSSWCDHPNNIWW